MCNLVHEEYKPIEKSGYAWKLFSKIGYNEILAQLFSRELYKKEYSGWISWNGYSFF